MMSLTVVKPPWDHWFNRVLTLPVLILGSTLIGLYPAISRAQTLSEFPASLTHEELINAPLPPRTEEPPVRSIDIAGQQPPMPGRDVNRLQGGLNPIVSEAYRLTNGDIISLWVANVPEYSTQYQVLGDGTVNLPVIGQVQVWGLTLQEAATLIAHRYETEQVLVDPFVTAVLASMNPLRIAIAGEVQHPGSYVLAPMNGESPSLTMAIETAGGITEKTDLQTVQIYRLTPDHRQTQLQVSLWDLLIEGDLSQDIPLADGDTIILSQATEIDFPTANQMAIASFASNAIQVNVVGEVNQPGLVTVPADTSLNEIILMAGGFNRDANQGAVGLFRLNPNGSINSRQIPINFSASVNADSNPLLHHRDVVIIGKSTGSNIRDISATITDILGSILSPISGILSVFDLFSAF
jgi:polysaccharide export outer membrane protein